MKSDMRAIAFYLPQYHPIPENDEWWGKGFTEWTNVAKARPQFPGHTQPHLPADLGFYDLRLSEAREAQANLAREHGIHGFCYYHYWFNGRRILERPFDEVLSSGKPELPFCLCWANENWTRIWDGGERDVLLGQHYSDDDDRAHILSLLPAFLDSRYIRIDGKPVFLVYRSGLLPNPRKTAETWQEEAKRAGLPGLYLIRVESHSDTTDPNTIGFDASVEFAPFNGLIIKPEGKSRTGKLLASLPFVHAAYNTHNIFNYNSVARLMWSRPDVIFKRFHCVTPGWDNTARRKTNATILVQSSPLIYLQWLSIVIKRTFRRFQGDEQLVFINAWNEWAEGNHLEPCSKWGHAYLQATREALKNNTRETLSPPTEEHLEQNRPTLRARYWALSTKIKSSELFRLLKYIKLHRNKD